MLINMTPQESLCEAWRMAIINIQKFYPVRHLKKYPIKVIDDVQVVQFRIDKHLAMKLLESA